MQSFNEYKFANVTDEERRRLTDLEQSMSKDENSSCVKCWVNRELSPDEKETCGTYFDSHCYILIGILLFYVAIIKRRFFYDFFRKKR